MTKVVRLQKQLKWRLSRQSSFVRIRINSGDLTYVPETYNHCKVALQQFPFIYNLCFVSDLKIKLVLWKKNFFKAQTALPVEKTSLQVFLVG